jgi:oxysterol-binding protein 1
LHEIDVLEESKIETYLSVRLTDFEDELERVSYQFTGPIRITLPSKRRPVKYKIFSIIKNFVGKDLTKFSLPIFLNEPLSLLQRLSELAKMIHLLDKAMAEEDPDKKLALMGVWALSNLAGSRRRLWKPFNPLLGETFELEGSYFKIFGEQVDFNLNIGFTSSSNRSPQN